MFCIVSWHHDIILPGSALQLLILLWWTFIFTGESVYFYAIECLFEPNTLQQTHILPICRFVNLSLAKTCFSVHLPHSSTNLTWFAFISKQKLDDGPLYKLRALFNLAPFWIASKQIFFRDQKFFCYKPIPNNLEFIIMEKVLKKSILLFSIKNPVFIEWPLYICQYNQINLKKKKFLKKRIHVKSPALLVSKS